MHDSPVVLQIARRILFVAGMIFWVLFATQAANHAWSREAVYGTDKSAQQLTGFVDKTL